MAGNVKFFFGSLAKYMALETKDPLGLYFVTDEATDKVYLYKGDKLYASDALASNIADGWMSKEDKISLDELVVTGGLNKLQAVDGSIAIVDSEDGKKNISVQISKSEGNLISVNSDGLFAKVDVVPLESVVGLVDRLEAIEKQSVGGIHYKGSVPTVADLPIDASEGDLYEVLEDNSEWCFNGEKWFEYGHTVDFSPIAGDGIGVDGRNVFISLADEANGLQFVDGKLSIAMATKDTAGALSAIDKAFIDAIPNVYATKKMVQDTAVQVKYNISGVPEGTLINYGEKEIRVMCPAGATFTKQQVGVGGDANTYYMTFKTYAPNDNAVGYIEHLNGKSDSEILTTFSTDEHGRRYQNTWLGMAKYDETSDTWSYYGKTSNEDHYVGFDYQIDWYDANGLMVASDNVRINLSNEDCHNLATPYYMSKYATIDEVNQSMTWGEL